MPPCSLNLRFVKRWFQVHYSALSAAVAVAAAAGAAAVISAVGVEEHSGGIR